MPSDNLLQISGTSVMVNLKMASGGDFSTFLSQLQSDGLSVSTSSATYGLVDGMLPIADLPAVATVAASVTAVPPPSQCVSARGAGQDQGPGRLPLQEAGPGRSLRGAIGRAIEGRIRAGSRVQTIDAGYPGGLA